MGFGLLLKVLVELGYFFWLYVGDKGFGVRMIFYGVFLFESVGVVIFVGFGVLVF